MGCLKAPPFPRHARSCSCTHQNARSSFQIFLSLVSRPAIQHWWGASSHKEAEFRLLPHPSPPITQASETDEILSLLYWFFCIAVFSLCPSRPLNPIGRVLVLQRSREDSLYPVMPLTLNKSSRVLGKGSTWKRAFCQMFLWRSFYFLLKPYLCADSMKCISQTDLLLSQFMLSNLRTNLWPHPTP